VGEGRQGRVESRPQAWRPASQRQPAPQKRKLRSRPPAPGCRCGKPGGLLHEGAIGRKREQWVKGTQAGSEADHRHDCRCGTQDCVLHASGRCRKPCGMLHWGRRKARSRPPARLPVWQARLRAPRERPAWQAWRLAPREAPAWHAPQRPEGRFFEGERGRRPGPTHAPGWYGGNTRAGKPATSKTVCGAAREAST